MNEKTEELRDIFIDVTDEETVTERQEETRGSLAADDGRADERVREVIGEMRERYDFACDPGDEDSSVDEDDLVRVVRGFFDGEDDAALAAAVGVDERTVFRIRTDLHLLRESDTDAPFDLSELRDMLVHGADVPELAERLGAEESTVRRYRRVVEARNEARRVSDRFRSRFADALTDVGLDAPMTEGVKEDGLEDATEGMETDVSF